MAVQTRDAIMSQEDVQSFVTRMRDMKDQKRAVTGGELGIPTVLLDVLHDTLHTYSKLLPYVHLVKVPGKARQTIAGTVPEGVWTEACAKLNELALSFAQVEVDGYKVGGFIPVCNALLEDSEINLVDEVMYAIGSRQSGFALDKAIPVRHRHQNAFGHCHPFGADIRAQRLGEPTRPHGLICMPPT